MNIDLLTLHLNKQDPKLYEALKLLNSRLSNINKTQVSSSAVTALQDQVFQVNNKLINGTPNLVDGSGITFQVNKNKITPVVTQSFAPFDPKTETYLEEEFYADAEYNIPTVSNGQIGQNYWGVASGGIGTGGTSFEQKSNHPGAVVLITANSSSYTRTLFLDNGLGSCFVPSEYFDGIFKCYPTEITNAIHRIGFSLGTPMSVKSMCFECTSADTNWFAYANNGTGTTRTDTGIARSTSYKTFRIRRVDASTIGYTIDNNSEILITTNLYTGASGGLAPRIEVITTAVNVRHLTMDFFSLRITGLSR